jgi:hypothetical protein
MRRLYFVLIVTLSALAAGCSFGRPTATTDSRAESAAPTLRVWDATWLDGGSGQLELRRTETAGGGLVLEVVASDTAGLKALYCDITYDSAEFSPVAAQATGELASGSTSPHADAAPAFVELNHLGEPGRAYLGQVLSRPQEQPGLRGSAVLARLELARRPFDAARAASLAPVSAASAANLSYDSANQTLRWGYYHQGDYDQNSVTTISDLTPMATRLQKFGPFDPDSLDAVVNGDGNAQINIADLTPIGVNFGRRVEKYNVYAGSPADIPAGPGDASTIAPLGSVPYDAKETGAGRHYFSFQLTAPDPQLFYWVRPADGDHEGTPSNSVQTGGVANTPPVINAIMATPSLINSAATSAIEVDATDADGDPLTYAYSVDLGSFNDDEGPLAEYQAPAVTQDETATLSVTVSDGRGGEAVGSVEVDISFAHVNTPPVIEQILSSFPNPIPSGSSPTLTPTVTDADGDTVTYAWSGDNGVSFFMPTSEQPLASIPPNTDEVTVNVTLTVDDGNGGTDTAQIQLVWAAPMTAQLTEVVLDPPGFLPGSGTLADPWRFEGTFLAQLQARSGLGDDLTGAVAWSESSAQPGTAFSGATAGALHASPFDSTFSATASLDGVDVTVFFSVPAPQ